MKTATQIFVFAIAPAAALIGAAVYDRSETTLRYTAGTTWEGDSAVFEYEDGRLMKSNEAKTVGLFGYGNPRLVAFGCDGAAAPLIAMEESDLPQCERIEVISNHKPRIEWN